MKTFLSMILCSLLLVVSHNSYADELDDFILNDIKPVMKLLPIQVTEKTALSNLSYQDRTLIYEMTTSEDLSSEMNKKDLAETVLKQVCTQYQRYGQRILSIGLQYIYLDEKGNKLTELKFNYNNCK